MPVADTSWLLRLVDEDDARHATARGQLEAAKEVVVPPVAIAEAMYVITIAQRRHLSHAEAQASAARALGEILATPCMRVRESTDADGAFRLMQTHPKLSFPDALVVMTAKSLRDELWTFDSGQQAAYQSL